MKAASFCLNTLLLAIPAIADETTDRRIAESRGAFTSSRSLD